MRLGIAAVVWLAVAAPSFGQEPLTIAAALDEASAFHPDLVESRRGGESNRAQTIQRAAEILAEVRRAHAELAIARDAFSLYDGIAPIIKDMADAGARGGGAGEMGRHDTSEAVLDLARNAVARSAAQQQVKIAEYRLNTALGRRVDAPVETLAMRDSATLPPVPAGLTPAARLRVLEARARVEGASERAMILTTTMLPQAALGFDGARAAYAAGRGTYMEMLDAHHRQLEARVEYVAIYAEYERALVALDVAMGESPERLARAAGPVPEGN
jgi:outer membrane protein TolC